jgi:recombination protein RecA
VGITCGAVEKKGAWLQFEGVLIGQGRDAAKKALVEKPELAQKIIAAIHVKRAAPPTAEK